MDDAEFEKIRREYDKVKSSMFLVAPFISSLLSRVRIVLTEEIPTAGVDRDSVMYVSPKFWNMLSWAGKAWVLAHETMHIAFRDLQRVGDRDREAWNLVCDGINNELIKQFLRMPDELKGVSVTMDKIWYLLEEHLEKQGITYEKLLTMSKEEVYRLLPKGGGGRVEPPKCPRCGSGNVRVKELDLNKRTAVFHCDDCGYEWAVDVFIRRGPRSAGEGGVPVDRVVGKAIDDFIDGDVEGKRLQDGDPDTYDKNKGDTEEKWKDNVAKAYDVQKTIGKLPGDLKRLVDMLLKPKVDWRSMLRQAFRVGLGRVVVSTWRRPSRKTADFPGLRRFTYPTVWCLVDCSGSISARELNQFISEVYDISGNSTVKVVVWDARVYDVVEANSRSEVIEKVVKRLRGGGGTMIGEALKTTLENMKSRDVVVVLSDMHIGDWDCEDTRRKLSEIASKASVAVLCSTSREVNAEGWRFIKIS